MTETSADDGAGRRVGQVVVVVGCALALVLAGAIAPSLGSPFDDGPAVNASQFANGDVANALANESDGSAPGNASGARDATEGVTSSPSSVVGSPRNYQVGGAQPLANFSRQSGGIQFVVEAASNSYYRVGAYQSFDGYGWSRDDARTAFSGAVPGATPPGQRSTARVTLNTSAYAVPVPWKPTSVEGPTPLSVRDTGGIVPRESLSANQSFTVTAVRPTRDPSVLSDSGYDYPSAVERTYLEVDDNVSDRVVDLADEVTADATNPYAEATAIEAWLEANKEYSLNATTDPERPVTRQFLFEMEAGYCQYFASSMAVMLRSQGVPARYVVGYAPGTQIGEETYAVTGSQAHAWVEVYFEGVGWVRFDPTPSAGREAADSAVANESAVRESFAESSVSDAVNASSFDPPGNGSTGAGSGGNGTKGGSTNGTDGSGGDGSGDGGDGSDGDSPTGDDEPRSVNVSLNRTAAPGSDVTVTVTRDGEPVSFAAVFFDGEYVGTTDYDGEVVGTVPFTRNLTVRVENVNESVRVAGDGATTMPAASVPGPPGGGDGRSVRFDVDAVSASEFRAAVSAGDLARSAATRDDAGTPDNDSATREFAVSADMTFALADEPTLGATVPVQVSIEGRPVPDATVRRDGAVVGTTNASGWVRVPLPSDASEVTVAAERGEVSDSAVVALVTTAAVSADGAAVPGGDLRVTARYDDAPLGNATVRLDGERVARTDAAGMATVPVPTEATGTVTVRVERGLVAGEASKDVVTNATLSFEDPLSPGADVVAAVRAADESVAGATVRVDGRAMGETDRAGLVTLSVPANATGNATVSATLGSLSTTRDVDLYEPNVSTTPAYLVALPGTPMSVNVTDAGSPVADATVRVVGGANASLRDARDANATTTGADGTAEVALPVRNAATVVVSSMGASASARLDWLFVNAFGALAVGVLAVVVVVGSLFERSRAARAVRALRRYASAAVSMAMNALFAVASRVDAFVAWLPSLPALVRETVERLVRSPVRALGAAWRRVAAWVTGVLAALVAALRGRRDGAPGESVGPGGAGGGDEPGATDGAAPRSLVEAWLVLVSLVSPSRLDRRTPAEIGRMALERGLPGEPVRTLTDAYERAVYGPSGASEEDVERARAAAASLESTAEPGDGSVADDGTAGQDGTGTDDVTADRSGEEGVGS
ncbi:transglutaminase domain-containing protein [Halorubellus sp. PRR65]|uniref:transglutaminase domain-containing protein n=1 Tax=Halorubellus sp. PRR65 TaxID=3098148 RepID=UPI002B25B1A9|nr:transglutaminase domain-containing protein [Halorubellus sp. PRR65]